MIGTDMAFVKELVVIFGDESIRREYLKQNEVDPFLVVSAIYPEILGVMQAGEAVSITVVRYPKKRWSRVGAAFANEIRDMEHRLDNYKQRGMKITEVVL